MRRRGFRVRAKSDCFLLGRAVFLLVFVRFDYCLLLSSIRRRRSWKGRSFSFKFILLLMMGTTRNKTLLWYKSLLFVVFAVIGAVYVFKCVYFAEIAFVVDAFDLQVIFLVIRVDECSIGNSVVSGFHS